MAKRVLIGDIIEIPTSKGLAYAQCSHIHWGHGHLIRVLPGFFKLRPTDFNALAAQQELFVVFYPIQAAVNKRFLDMALVGHADLPENARKFPIFRFGMIDPSTNRVEVWCFWDGVKRWKVGQITEEEMKMPFQQIWTGSTLVEAIEEGWTWASYPGSRAFVAAAERIRANRSSVSGTLSPPDPKSSQPTHVEYYFYFPSKDAAGRAAAELQADHFAVDVRPSAQDDGQWLALVSCSVRSGEPTIADLQEKFEDLATKYGGEYDGWQANVTESVN